MSIAPINAEILHRIRQRIGRRAEQPQQVTLKQQEQHGQHGGKAPERGGTGAERAFGAILLPCSEGDRGARRAAHAHERGKRGDECDDRKSNAHAGQRELALERDATDIDAVDDIVEKIDDLRGDGRQREPDKQTADRVIPEVGRAV